MKRTLVALGGAAALLAACGTEEPSSSAAEADPGLVHIHGLGVNPADRSLFIATHTGLFRAADGEPQLARVGDERQDTMGFTVVGPDRFLGSGHPDPRSDLPPFLGLIESSDAGDSWRSVSLEGSTDFHVLEASGDYVYGFGSNFKTRAPTFLVSSDGGLDWRKRAVPSSLASLAIDPADREHVVASTEDQSYASTDAGETWRPLGNRAGFLAWTAASSQHIAGFDGTTAVSSDAGRTWTDTAAIGGRPAAFEQDDNDLLVALHNGTVKASDDGGQTWSLRATP